MDSKVAVATLPPKEAHDVYDATSRSRSLPSPLPPSFHGASDGGGGGRGEREDLKVADATRAFAVHGILSNEECEFLLRAVQEIGWEHSDVAAEYPADYRNSERIIALSKELADSLWPRIQSHLKAKDIRNVTPVGCAVEGTWLPVHLNECFMFSRYKTGDFFKPHYDGIYKNAYQEISIFTVTVYLNDDFEGGRLIFRKSKEEPDEVLNVFQPKRGSALVFNHDTLHEGEAVTQGTKYIMRTSIMFARVEDLSDKSRKFEQDPRWQHMREVFASFDGLLAAGDTNKFTSSFLEVQSIQLSFGRSIHDDPSIGGDPILAMPPEIVDRIFSLLTPADLCRAMNVSRAWKMTTRSGRTWKRNYILKWGSSAVAFIERPFARDEFHSFKDDRSLEIDPELTDWFGLYRDRTICERRFSPAVIFVSMVAAYGFHDGKFARPFEARCEPSYDPWDGSFECWYAGPDLKYGLGRKLDSDDDSEYYGRNERVFAFASDSHKWFSQEEQYINWQRGMPLLPELWNWMIRNMQVKPSHNPVTVITIPPFWTTATNDSARPKEEKPEAGASTKPEDEGVAEFFQRKRGTTSTSESGEANSLQLPMAHLSQHNFVNACDFLKRRFRAVAVSFIDIGLCMLLGTSTDRGIVVCKFPTRGEKGQGKRLLIHVAAYRDMKLVAEDTSHYELLIRGPPRTQTSLISDLRARMARLDEEELGGGMSRERKEEKKDKGNGKEEPSVVDANIKAVVGVVNKVASAAAADNDWPVVIYEDGAFGFSMIEQAGLDLVGKDQADKGFLEKSLVPRLTANVNVVKLRQAVKESTGRKVHIADTETVLQGGAIYASLPNVHYDYVRGY